MLDDADTVNQKNIIGNWDLVLIDACDSAGWQNSDGTYHKDNSLAIGYKILNSDGSTISNKDYIGFDSSFTPDCATNFWDNFDTYGWSNNIAPRVGWAITDSFNQGYTVPAVCFGDTAWCGLARSI